MGKHEITRDDIMPMDAYAKERTENRRAMIEVKRHRRVSVGPDATFYFENYQTMWRQIHEMLYIEQGGEDQIKDELAAYNPLIPKGNEFVATLMFEIDDAQRRDRILSMLGGVEQTLTLTLGDEIIAARPETDVERTNEDGKASSVHFIRFSVTPAQAEKFRDANVPAVLGIGHKKYAHMAVLSENVRRSLAEDLDA
jgi:hypothetical protein